MTERFCAACGAERDTTDGFCTACGARFDAIPPQPAQPAMVPPAVFPPAGVPVPPAPRRRRWPFVLALGCLGTVLLCALVPLALVLFAPGGGTAALSPDQRRVAEEFGLPRTFTIACGEDVIGALEGDDLDTHRVEAWDYYELGTRFIFRDGVVMATRRIEPLDPEACAYPALSPAAFAEGMSEDDVSEIMGFEPDAGGTVTPEIADGLEVRVWDGLLSCVFENGGLVSAQTAPVLEGGSR